MQYDSGSCAAFTEQGSSASQMTSATSFGGYCHTTWMRKTSKRRSVSLHPSQISRIYGFGCRDTRDPKRGKAFKNLWFRVKEMCTDTALLDCCGRDSLKRSGLRMHWRKRSGKLLLCAVANGTGLFLSVYVDDTMMARKMHNLDPMWKRLKETR